MSSELSPPIVRQIAETARRRAQLVEEACERALQGGEHGVKVVMAGSQLVSADPDPSVPYGRIHEHQIIVFPETGLRRG